MSPTHQCTQLQSQTKELPGIPCRGHDQDPKSPPLGLDDQLPRNPPWRPWHSCIRTKAIQTRPNGMNDRYSNPRAPSFPGDSSIDGVSSFTAVAYLRILVPPALTHHLNYSLRLLLPEDRFDQRCKSRRLSDGRVTVDPESVE